MNCTELCGNCKNGTTCEATNGECRHGCEPGWMAVACKDGIYFQWRFQVRNVKSFFSNYE